jgi:hypothetical protein
MSVIRLNHDDTLILTLSAVPTTSSPTYSISYSDYLISTNVLSSSATVAGFLSTIVATTVVTTPAVGYIRNIETIILTNNDTVNTTKITSSRHLFTRTIATSIVYTWTTSSTIAEVAVPSLLDQYIKKTELTDAYPRTIGLLINSTDALTTSTGKAYVRIPSVLTGMKLHSVAAHCQGASSSGNITIQINNTTTTNNMLSTVLTIEEGEYDSLTSATTAVINSSYATVTTGDWLYISCPTAGTGVTWLFVELQFQIT